MCYISNSIEANSLSLQIEVVSTFAHVWTECHENPIQDGGDW